MVGSIEKDVNRSTKGAGQALRKCSYTANGRWCAGFDEDRIGEGERETNMMGSHCANVKLQRT